jgi:kynurenine formamidase
MPCTPCRIAPAVALAASFAAAPLGAAEPGRLLAQSQKHTPAPPWPAGDERGMANAIGHGTWQRCAWHLGQSKAKAYEISHLRSNTMPLSPFTGPMAQKPKPTQGLPGTAHAFNGETLNEGAEPGQQGTQIDALGHFGYFKQPWDGKPPVPAEQALYYGGFTQKDVKPTPDSPLLKLGMDKVPPIVTTAVLLDAKTHVGGGKPMKDGELVTAKHLDEMLKAQGIARRGILPGDVVYVRTGWGDHWKDPDTEKFYYAKAPGISFDAAHYLAQRRIVAISLDAPFIDPAAEGALAGKAPPAPGTPPGLPFAVHHHMLAQAGIYLLENAKLDEIAEDKVWVSCTMILPLREKGAAGSAVRPVAIGVPGR